MYDNKVVYQIYPKSFKDTNGDGIGDLLGIIEKLDYIKELGVDYIWLCPINKSPQYDNGYDISDYYDIDPLFGTLEDYKQLIFEAKKRGIKIMHDLVLNHTSTESEWFKRALCKDPKYYDYFIWRDEPNELKSFFSTKEESAWTYVEQLDKYYFHIFDEHQPDLNWANEQVRNEMYNIINYWIDFGVEGFRLDAINLIGKDPDRLITYNGPKYIEYLHQMHDLTFKDDILTVGECGGSLKQIEEMCNNGFTQTFHMHNLFSTNVGGDKWTQNPIDYNYIAKVIKNWQNNYFSPQTWVMANHDNPRLVSLWGNDDEYRYESATCLATLFTLLRGTQYIYQGEEIGMTDPHMMNIDDYKDIETLNAYEKLIEDGLSDHEVMEKISKVSRDNPRVPMQWTGDDNRGFSSAKPWIKYNDYNRANVEDDLASPKSVYKYYQKLIKLKKETFDNYINYPLDTITCVDDVICYERKGMKVICNLQNVENEYPLSNQTIVLNNYERFDGRLKPYQTIVCLEKSY